MGKRLRPPSLPAIELFAVMLREPGSEYYGLELAEATGRPTGTVYPLLKRCEEKGWLTSSHEDIDPSVEKRPRRRLYRFTRPGEAYAREQVELVQHSPAFRERQPVDLAPR